LSHAPCALRLYVNTMSTTRSKRAPSTKNEEQEFPKDLDFASTHNLPLVENRHQQIVDGACRVFFKKGYHPTTTREIASACGMSIGQLYHYISCKEDVLYLVLKHMQDVWCAYLKKANIDQIPDPVQRLRKALNHSLEFMVENKKLVQFMYSESKYLDKKYFRIFIQLHDKNVVGYWRKLLEDVGRAKTVKGDVDFLSSLTAYLLAFPAMPGWTLEDNQNERHLDAIVDFILRGLGVS
jgi:AcrR family transcriptional regulator